MMYRRLMANILMVLACVPMQASDWDIVDVTVVDNNQQTKQSFKVGDYLLEHVFGDVNGRYRVGGHYQRANYQVQFGFSDHFHYAKMVLSGAYRKQYIRTAYNQNQAMNQSTVFAYDEVSIRDGYLEFFPIPKITISAGKQIIVWGQQFVVSPVDLFLPLDVNPVGYSLSKADNRQPLTAVRLTVYPAKNVALIGYYFPEFEPGGLFRYMNDALQDYDAVIPSGPSSASYAYRAIWYGDLMTAALTYHNGYNAIPRRKESITNDSKEYGYYKRQAVGAELSVPMNGVYFRSEVSVMQDDIFIQTSGLSSTQRWALIHYNSNSNAVPAVLSVVSIGLDGDFDSWFMNAYLMKAQYLIQLSNHKFWEAFGAYNKYPNSPIIPSITLGRYLSEEKSGAYGMSLGYFSGSLGASVFYIQKMTPAFSWHASFDYSASIADILVHQANGLGLSYLMSEPSLGIGLRQVF